MSAITLPIAELKPALIGLAKVLNKHATLPVLSTIRIERTPEGWITLTATDLDFFATVRLEQPSEGEPATLLVPFEDLQKTVKSCGKGEQIQIEAAGEDSVTIRYAIGQQFAETKVTSFPVGEFPTIPQIQGEPVALPEALRESILQAMECASTDETRYILNGACIDVSEDGCYHVVATDGRHLYSSNSFSLPLKKGFILRSHRFLKWKEFSADGEWQLRISRRDGNLDYVQISSRRWTFISWEIGGNYPNWRQVVPKADESKNHIEIDPASLDQVLATISRMPCHDSTNFTIGVEVESEKLNLLGKNETAEKWTRVEVPAAKISGKPMLIFLNRHYLSKALRFGLTRVDLIDPMSPLLFINGGRRMVVMPVRSEAVPPTPAVANTPAAEPNGEGAAEPVNSEPEQPTSTTNERSHMVNQNTSSDAAGGSSPTPVNNASKIEEALEQIDALKESLQTGITGLKDLSIKLKQIQKEQKTSEREFQSIRSTLRTLQSVKI